MYYAGILVGFDQNSYTFEEPEFQSFRTGQVCFRLFTGQLDQTIMFRVTWNPITAAAGLPLQGGDYTPQSEVYILSPGVRLNCIDILIHRDNALERREEFQGDILSIQLPNGQILPSVEGISVQPGNTRIFIDNIDGRDAKCRGRGGMM